MPANIVEIGKPQMTVYDLTRTVEFGRLAPKMGHWVIVYVQTFLDTGDFDSLAATKAAYDCGTAENARTFGYQMLANPKVKKALDKFFGNDAVANRSREDVLAEAWRAVQAAEPGSIAHTRSISFYKSLAGIERPKKPKAEKPSQTPAVKFKVGDVATQNGVKYRVTEVDADGKILDAKEIS
jgi:hypothetical protein